ncbi:hypothetical protein Pres01_00980 [Metapseudomonas resinovorans]|nr:hypothetical protein Pres01_00980 [Pseudomonas resinovorans]
MDRGDAVTKWIHFDRIDGSDCHSGNPGEHWYSKLSGTNAEQQHDQPDQRTVGRIATGAQ